MAEKDVQIKVREEDTRMTLNEQVDHIVNCFLDDNDDDDVIDIDIDRVVDEDDDDDDDASFDSNDDEAISERTILALRWMRFQVQHGRRCIND